MNTDCDSEQKALDFDAFLKLHGYDKSAPDCANIQNEKDCLERGEQEPACCESCRKFAEIADHWENICERNALRVARAGDVVVYYGRLPGADKECAFGDLLADLRHFAAKEGFDWDFEINRAVEHYEAEIGGEL